MDYITQRCSVHHLAFSREGDAWLLSRQVPGSAHQAKEPPRSGTSLTSTYVLIQRNSGSSVTKLEDADSGLDSLQEEVTEKEQSKECVIQSDEMQVVHL